MLVERGGGIWEIDMENWIFESVGWIWICGLNLKSESGDNWIFEGGRLKSRGEGGWIGNLRWEGGWIENLKGLNWNFEGWGFELKIWGIKVEILRGKGGQWLYYCVKNYVICVKIRFGYPVVMVFLSSILIVYFLVVLNNIVVYLG